MDDRTEMIAALEELQQPAFLAREGTVTQVNAAAKALLIQPGMAVVTFLHTGAEEYAGFSGGRLYLTLTVEGCRRQAHVRRLGQLELFILEQSSAPELDMLALAARELREPLSKAIASAERISASQGGEDSLRLNRGLYQMLRILGNMTDAAGQVSHQETVDIAAVFAEVFAKASTLLPHAGIEVRYQGPGTQIYGLADPEQLERAVLNILSNSMKFTPKGGHVEASLSKRDRLLQLTIRDSGSGIPEEVLPTVFSRYLRQPAIEDCRYGMGLGMALIKSAAEAHGGTVLIDTPPEGGTRITLTMALRQSSDDTLRSPILRIDRYGGRDRALIELSDSLPPELYDLSK